MLSAQPPVDMQLQSEIGKQLNRQTQEIRRYTERSEFLSPAPRPEVIEALWTLLAANSRPNWNGYGALAASLGSHGRAVSFLSKLPQQVQDPEVDMDPDGEFSFDWFGQERDHLLSVSIGASNSLTFAYRNGAERRTGAAVLREKLPTDLLVFLNSFRHG